ncbi:type I-E CRISPR-associated protein Cse1/CasA [Streptomyces sp. ITFR-16]|uniref:type I-E CRISPR-associated protein Cse1/CasA n=1 Tax=Streptomyces sp. ITFR-16 TaxID=3075198 RepID=UPI00288AE14F|nr:type I-E CRISPR-associated protein Cse1/CasA [Streptomyces sp. ITFR-16]WNI23811.1 type I-E CRISPR-associated protein Cse1/CasA [Streptomyces sp. ITFR-16]
MTHPRRCPQPLPHSKLTASALAVWAKHDRAAEGWVPLWQHMSDSAAVAGLLWDQWVPRLIRQQIADALPGPDDARRLVVWLAATHDIGKATPAFACQVDGLAQGMREAGLDMPHQHQWGEDRRMAPHGLAGQLLMEEWLMERHGWPRRSAGQFAVVIGGHHGVPPGYTQIHDLDRHPELLRTPGVSEERWRGVQTELLDVCAETYGTRSRLHDWKSVKLPQTVQVLLTALVITADWIASSSDLFPYFPEDIPRTPDERISAAWTALDLPGPWEPEEPDGTVDDLYRTRFDLPAGAAVRPVQEAAVRLARALPEPGLMVIEAPMGEGKTEAALAVAEIFAARSGAGGCFVALPTRATGNAMFPRLLKWLEHLPGTGRHSVFLAHAKAALNDEYAGLIRPGGASVVRSVDVDGPDDVRKPSQDGRPGSAEYVAHQWLRGRKKGMLSSFAVGTIDQLLFAGLKSRHLALRHLALAGKVVVIDEVHAYDAYMNVYLERVLSWLGSYGVPVVMLSATLPAGTRRELIQAYAGTSAEESAASDQLTDYPLLTAVCPGHVPGTEAPPAAVDRGTDIDLVPLDDDVSLLGDTLADALAGGGCALVVRNTVDRVLETAERLGERFGRENVTVAHSRFMDLDRAARDAELLRLFGPDGDRPSGTVPHIVVASQVAEQSLDVDFDLLVTDLCPVDLMLQRLGRLHRHQRGPGQRNRPAAVRRARCLVTGVDWKAVPVPEPVRGSERVYGLHNLLRSLAVLRPYLDGSGRTLGLPQDIHALVQTAYGDEPIGPENWSDAMAAADLAHRTHRAEQQAGAEVHRLDRVRKPGRPVIGWVEAGVGDADDSRVGRAQVRDSEESLEVLVVQRQPDGSLTTVPWLDRGRGGLALPTDAIPPSRAAKALAESSMRLPFHFSKPWVLDRSIAELEELLIPAWQVKECPWLAGELILALDEHCQTHLAGYEIEYSKAEGLRVGRPGARDVRLVEHVPSFDLVSRPWLPVQRTDGTADELSLLDVFSRATTVRRLVGDVPTQEFALLRLLLAILHDAVDGPEDVDDWAELWESEDAFEAVPAYLERHRARFDLLHPQTPFFQVAGLHTEKQEISSLNRIVADVPNGAPFFSMRVPGAGRLGFAEAARWLVHTHAFDTSGIKSGMVGDDRVKGGRVYPQGVGWAGNLGGVVAEGANLRETLLLNLVAPDNNTLRFRDGDTPAWRREPLGPGADSALNLAARPTGPRDLYTWQSRRVLLHHDDTGVYGVALGYGDPLVPRNKQPVEPMTGWRHSEAQEKKHGLPQVYMPREHDPTRGAWRGLASLLQDVPARGGAQSGKPAATLRPGLLSWMARLVYEQALPRGFLLRTRIVGARYGTQQSVIDELIDDGVTMPVVLLHAQDERYGRAAIDAVGDADLAARALGDLAGDLARAAGSDPEARRLDARERAYGELDGPYRLWLRHLGESDDPARERWAWQAQAYRVIRELGRELLDSVTTTAWEGRVIDLGQGPQWFDDTSAEKWFRIRLRKALPRAVPLPAPRDGASTDERDVVKEKA